MLITLILNIYTLISKCLNHYLTIAMKNTIYLRHAFHKRINTCIVEDFDLNIDRRITLKSDLFYYKKYTQVSFLYKTIKI